MKKSAILLFICFVYGCSNNSIDYDKFIGGWIPESISASTLKDFQIFKIDEKYIFA